MSIVIAERTIVWTIDLRHPAYLVVQKQLLFGDTYNWSSFVYCDGELTVTFPFDTPANKLWVGSVTTGANPVPGNASAGKGFSTTVVLPGAVTTYTANFRLGEGNWSQTSMGVLTVSAPCEVIYDLDDLGQNKWSDRAFWRDMPDNTLAHLRLRLKEAATVSLQMTGNTTPLTGTIGTVGEIFGNDLQLSAVVKSIAKATSSYTANGSIGITCNLGDYACDSETKTWAYSGGTCIGSIATNNVAASAVNTSGYEMTAQMSCSRHLERTANLEVAIRDIGGGSIDAGVAISRYADDTHPASASASSGGYSEAISQRAWSWSWSATHSLGSSDSGSGSWTNWGDFGCSLYSNWCDTEQPDLPTGWGVTSYLRAKDSRLLLHTFWQNNLVSIAQESAHDTLLGYQAGYTQGSNQLLATGTTPVGTWGLNAGSIELDTVNNAILIKPPSAGCDVTRTIELSADQYGDTPSRPPREAWAGYRWLQVAIEPVDPATGSVLTRDGDTIAICVEQDNMADLWADADKQTWNNTTLQFKRYSCHTVRASGNTTIDVDLAKPVNPTHTADGGNPAAENNFGSNAEPNVLSRYPQPTLDAAHGGVTNAKALTLTLPGGVWWRIKGISLHHKTGIEPTIALMPAWNQWIRSLRMDKHDDDDLTASKDWRKRMLATQCEGLLGAEAFDLNRHSTHIVSEELGEYDEFAWSTVNGVAEVVKHLTAVQQLTKWVISGDTDIHTPAGAIRSYPGWSINIASVDAGSISEHLLSIGVNLGGRGITWIGDTPVVWNNMALASTLVVQGLAGSVDWFGGCGDLFGLNNGQGTALALRACTVLRGSAEGLGLPTDNYELAADSVIATNTPDATGHLLLPAGHQSTSHTIRKSGISPSVNYDRANTITWLYRPSLTGTGVIECTEAPCWWHNRGIHWVLLQQQLAYGGAVSYAVSGSGRGARAIAKDGTITLQQATDCHHAVWVNVGSRDGDRAAICWCGGAKDELLMLWAESGSVKAAFSSDSGRSFGNVETIGAGDTTACAKLVNGLLIEAWINSGAIKVRTVSPTGSVAMSELTAVASGADAGALAVGERIHGGTPEISLYYSTSGTITRKSSVDGGRSWS